jgi:hypothetical protein
MAVDRPETWVDRVNSDVDLGQSTMNGGRSTWNMGRSLEPPNWGTRKMTSKLKTPLLREADCKPCEVRCNRLGNAVDMRLSRAARRIFQAGFCHPRGQASGAGLRQGPTLAGGGVCTHVCQPAYMRFANLCTRVSANSVHGFRWPLYMGIGAVSYMRSGQFCTCVSCNLVHAFRTILYMHFGRFCTSISNYFVHRSAPPKVAKRWEKGPNAPGFVHGFRPILYITFGQFCTWGSMHFVHGFWQVLYMPVRPVRACVRVACCTSIAARFVHAFAEGACMPCDKLCTCNGQRLCVRCGRCCACDPATWMPRLVPRRELP